jgi:hypothetical protein
VHGQDGLCHEAGNLQLLMMGGDGPASSRDLGVPGVGQWGAGLAAGGDRRRENGRRGAGVA